MAIAPGARDSRLELCVEASSSYLLTEVDAREIVDRQIETIAGEWGAVADAAGFTADDRRYFERRQILNPYAFEGYSSPSPW